MGDKENLSWKHLVWQFTQDTTFHGVRYITGDSKFFIRRILWALAFSASLGIFSWFCYNQLALLLDHQKSVSVEVIFEKSVEFPTVTICNQNLFKRSLAHKFGLHDTIVEAFSNANNSETKLSSEIEMESVQDFDLKESTTLTGLGSVTNFVYTSVTVEVCKLTCIRVVSDSCCSLLYDKRRQTCTITSLEPTMPDVSEKRDRNIDFYRRHSCNIQRTAACNFGTPDGGASLCNFKVDLQKPVQWKATQGRGRSGTSRPNYDHTQMSRLGYFMYASKSRQQKEGAHLLSPNFLANNTCLEFFHQIRQGRLNVYQGLRNQRTLVWSRGKAISTDWERGYVALPDRYIRVTIEAISEDGGVNIALDDVTISECKPIQECRDTSLGLGYVGTQSMTRMDKMCQRWDELPTYRRPESWNFESLNISDEANYCRNPDNDPLGLWCITNIETVEMDYCDVPLCDCRDVDFTCDNGRCVSKEQSCDGEHDDCGDISDEAYCDNLGISVNCSFDAWNCSYSSPQESLRKWHKRDTRDGNYMTVDYNSGREGDYAILQSPAFNLTQTGCLEMRYNLTHTDKLDVFIVHEDETPGDDSLYREHICTLPGINHTYYNPGVDQNSPRGYNFSADIPAGYSKLVLIANALNDSESRIIIYQINLADINCTELYAPPVEYTTSTNATMNFTTESNTTVWSWNQTEMVTTEWTTAPKTTAEPTTIVTTMEYNLTTEFIPIYEPMCVANFSEDCESCLKDPFFYTRSPNETNIDRGCDDPEIQSISCYFTDECLCGYKFTSSNRNWVWKQELLSNFSTEEDGKALMPYAYDMYLRVHNLSESSRQGDWIRLFSPIENFVNASCLQFQYFSRYMDVKVFSYNETYTKLLLAITYDGQKRTWHPSATNIQPGRHGIIFELTYAQFALKNAGIDNVTITPGVCESESLNPDVNCTFEEDDWCGYMDVSEGPRNWYRTLGGETGPDTTIFPRVTPGNYFLRTRNIEQGKVSRLLQSPQFHLDQTSCLTYDFFDSAGDAKDTAEIRTLSVNLITYSNRRIINTTIWRIFGTMKDDEWHYAQVNISSGDHRLLFEVNGDNYRVGIKNITVTPGACAEYNCSRESSKSDWFACETFFACLSPKSINDGIPNCEGGEDEDPAVEDDDEEEQVSGDSEDQTPINADFNLPDPIRNLKDLYKWVGHQGEDLIYKCEWNGQDCDFLNFTTTITDYGLCYMFNDIVARSTDKTGKTSPLYSTQTGARFGLKLTLNIEQYEYMIGPNTDAGLKIFLHSGSEEPQVRDLGFAISPGRHALAGIQRNDAINLPEPWGECSDDMELKYYNRYTFSACEVECETDDLLDVCHCRDAYMPGLSNNSPRYCNISEYFNCAVPHLNQLAASLEKDKSSSSKCAACPQPCDQTVYEPSLSYALLSTLSVDQLLSRDDFDLEGKYKVALETVQRVDPDIFIDDLNMLSALARAYEDMERLVLEFLNADPTEATAIKILNSTAQIRLLAVEDCFQLLGEVKDFKRVFEAKYKTNIELLDFYNSSLKSSYDQVKQLIGIAFRTRMPEEYLKLKAENGLMWSVLAFETVDALRKDMVEADLERDNGKFVPERYFKNREACTREFQSTLSSLSQLRQSYSEISLKSEGQWDLRNDGDDLDRRMDEYSTNILKIDECLSEYSSILNRITMWLADNTISLTRQSNEKNIKEQEETIDDFKDNREHLKEDKELVKKTLDDYATNTTDKLSYLKAIVDEKVSDGTTLLSRIDLFTSRVQTETVNPLSDIVADSKRKIEQQYRSVLNLAVELDYYMPKDYFYGKASGMQIWKLPAPSLEPPQTPLFYRETLEMWKIWDQNMPLQQFVQCEPNTDNPICNPNIDGRAIEIIKNALEQKEDFDAMKQSGYFRILETTIGQFEADVASLKQKITDEIAKIASEKSQFEKQKTIDEDFISENFLNIDVYFKQLKYQKVEQTKAYVLLDFLSDVGGYLGLLLGASVLTMCELIDLFLYNSIKKTLASSEETSFVGASGEPEPNGKAVPASNNALEMDDDEPPDEVTKYGMEENRGFEKV